MAITYSIKSQMERKQEVLVKLCHFFPVEKDGIVEIRPMKEENGWIRVLLAVEVNGNEVDELKVHYTPRTGTYTFHHPDTTELVLFNGKVDNPLNPTTQVIKNVERLGESPTKCHAYVAKVTKSEVLADTVMSLIADRMEEFMAKQAA